MYVLMVIPDDFPNGDAGAVRATAFAYIYQDLGYMVFLIGAGRGDKEGNYQGVHFYSLYKKANNLGDHLFRFLSYPGACMKLVNRVIEENGPPAIIHVNSILEPVIGKLIKMAKMNNIPILHDSTEWYSPCEFSYGKLDKAYIMNDWLNRKVIRYPMRAIGISSYLTEYFQQRGLKAVRIPVIMDIQNAKTSVNTGDKVKLIYAGSPANKDYLKEIVIGVTLLSEEHQKKMELHILGANEEQILRSTRLSALPTCIIPYGRVSHEKVEEIMLQMDFSVLLRPSEERYAKAGFPTKSVEAMSHGIAMICNISSDLGMYLKDGVNAVIVDGYDESSFSNSLERVLSMSRDEINLLKINARTLAEDEFDYRKWTSTVKSLIA